VVTGKHTFIHFQTIQNRLLVAAMELIMRERLGEGVESSLVVSTRQAFVNYDHGKDEPLKMYENHFEKQYIDSCRDFYTPRANQVNSKLVYIHLFGLILGSCRQRNPELHELCV
jgi:hypothetical protein